MKITASPPAAARASTVHTASATAGRLTSGGGAPSAGRITARMPGTGPGPPEPPRPPEPLEPLAIAGRSASAIGWYATECHSAARPLSTSPGSAGSPGSASTCSASAVLPAPASPVTNTTGAWPERADRTKPRSTSASAVRPASDPPISTACTILRRSAQCYLRAISGTGFVDEVERRLSGAAEPAESGLLHDGPDRRLAGLRAKRVAAWLRPRVRQAEQRGEGVVNAAYRVEVVGNRFAGHRLDDQPAAAVADHLPDVPCRPERVAHVMQAVEGSHQVIARPGEVLCVGHLEVDPVGNARVRCPLAGQLDRLLVIVGTGEPRFRVSREVDRA